MNANFGSILFIILVIIFIALCIITYKKIKNITFVKAYSKRYQYLFNLSKDMSTLLNYNRKINVSCTSLRQFNNFNFDKKFKRYLSDDNTYKTILSLNKSYKEYKNKWRKSPKFTTEDEFNDFSISGISFKSFSKYETDLCDSLIIPENNLSYIYQISYVSPAGRNHYANQKSFSTQYVLMLCKQINDSNLYSKRKRTVTAGQRQRILRRDNFTCQLCGAKGPGAGGTAELQVDHKVPFSKGGSDDDSNLWTLCKACNLGKSNKYIDA